MAKEKSTSAEINAAIEEVRTAAEGLKAKAKQPMNVTAAKKKTYTVAKLKKSAKTFKAVNVKKARGTVTYKVSGSRKSKKMLSFNKKSGKVTVKKGAAKGSYSLRITVAAAGNGDYLAGKKTVTVKVKVR